MSKITVTKEFTWSMAHMLANHAGLCRNIHGHTYKIQVEIERKEGGLKNVPGLTDHQMVMEFKDVSALIRKIIVDPLDHTFLYWKNSTDDLEHEIVEVLRKHKRKVVEIDYRPTAESMAINFLAELREAFAPEGMNVTSIVVWESPTSYATAN